MKKKIFSSLVIAVSILGPFNVLAQSNETVNIYDYVDDSEGSIIEDSIGGFKDKIIQIAKDVIVESELSKSVNATIENYIKENTCDIEHTKTRLELIGGSVEGKKYTGIPQSTFKAYEPWHLITNKRSIQYKLKSTYWIDDRGYCRHGEDYVVAVGSAFGRPGNRLKVEMSTGQVFNVIIGDQKQDRDTDSTNRQCIHNGSILEFIVDKRTFLPTKNKFSEFEGSVVSIERYKESLDDYIMQCEEKEEALQKVAFLLNKEDKAR